MDVLQNLNPIRAANKEKSDWFPTQTADITTILSEISDPHADGLPSGGNKLGTGVMFNEEGIDASYQHDKAPQSDPKYSKLRTKPQKSGQGPISSSTNVPIVADSVRSGVSGVSALYKKLLKMKE